MFAPLGISESNPGGLSTIFTAGRDVERAPSCLFELRKSEKRTGIARSAAPIPTTLRMGRRVKEGALRGGLAHIYL